MDGFWAQGSGLLRSEDSGLNAVGFGIQVVRTWYFRVGVPMFEIFRCLGRMLI